MSKITAKNTKNEILEAYEKALNEIKSLKEGKTTTAEVVKAKEVKATKQAAKEIVELNILNDDMVGKYNSLISTIEMLEKDIEELYGIKNEADSLEALVNSHKDLSAKLTQEHEDKLANLNKKYEEKRTELIEDLDKMKKENMETLEALRLATKEEKAKLDKERAREKEEYTYNLNRERAIENDKWFDEKTTRERLLAAREENVAERELEIDRLEEKVSALESKIDDLTDEKQEMYNKGFEEGKIKAKKEAETAKIFSDRAHKSELDRKEDVIESLRQSNEELRRSNDMLQSKLDASYDRIQSMSMEVAKNSGTRIVESTTK